MNIAEPAIESYADAHTTPVPEHLVHVDAETRQHLDSPGMMVGHLEGRFLEMLVASMGARRVLEIGTFSGYSSISMAAGLPEGGRITTCELSSRHAEFARRHIELAGLSEVIEVREGPALDTLRTVEGPFDFVFIDADKSNYAAYYEAVLPLLAERALIAVDNTLWSGRVLDASDESQDSVAMRQFNDQVVADERVVVVQLTVRDGITLIRKR